ncbi:MAG: serine/threonine protein kinase [Polyangiaceae bacterium]|nr:serine/threonine protein kinase [Polyangiaceae bacterium]
MTPSSRGPRVAGFSDPFAGLGEPERPGVVLAGKFELIELLGRGGMGSVWKARDLLLERVVAIKLIRVRRGLDDAGAAEARVRFEREARAAAQLRTRHVVQIYEYGFHGETPYIAMELLAGETLKQRLDRVGRLPPIAAAAILDQAARALEQAHAAGIVHRDLKPANIFLAREDSEEVVKILDFGVAKETGAEPENEATATGQMVGSPYYMSPEQARGARDLDGRSDLWSMAVILFRALTGQKAFPGGSLGAVMAQILSEPIPVPSHVAPDLPPAIDRFFERALARDPGARFQSAAEMARAWSALAALISSDRWPAAHELARAETLTGGSLSGQAPLAMTPSSSLRAPSRAPDPGALTTSGMTHTSRPPGHSRVLWGAIGVGFALAAIGGGVATRIALAPAAPAEGAPEAPAATATASAEPAPSAAQSAAPAAEPSAAPGAQSAAPEASAAPPAPASARPRGGGAPVKTKPKWF